MRLRMKMRLRLRLRVIMLTSTFEAPCTCICVEARSSILEANGRWMEGWKPEMTGVPVRVQRQGPVR